MNSLLKWLFVIGIGILVGGVLHIASLLAVPMVAPRDAYSRLASFGQPNNFTILDDEGDRSLPFLDPSFLHLTCRFDLTDGAVNVRVPLASEYATVSFYARDGAAFFSLNDRSTLGRTLDIVLYDPEDANFKMGDISAGTIPVAAPGLEGLVIVRAFAPVQSTRGAIRDELAKAVCASVAEN